VVKKPFHAHYQYRNTYIASISKISTKIRYHYFDTIELTNPREIAAKLCSQFSSINRIG